ncbi:hypothetical protein BJF83_17235 [Nocardiopsis sp. CNR-923]|uniref:hypothetical protein n=1 Tax=Nocardiopsis sp. CNR-923 TaxID=1904965 RepID=UPI00096999D8|nr:hypothetical protein [Nocardiopsis sp. CNR-923]OLT27834.1 hypothetical protein BJF83_17235 [Nocardiopsis sp. CNR-923]
MRRNGRRREPASLVPGTHSLATLYRGDDAVLYQGELDFDGASVVAKVLDGARSRAGGTRPACGRSFPSAPASSRCWAPAPPRRGGRTC